MTMSAPPLSKCLSGGRKVAAPEGNHHLMCFPSDGGRWVQGRGRGRELSELVGTPWQACETPTFRSHQAAVPRGLKESPARLPWQLGLLPTLCLNDPARHSLCRYCWPRCPPGYTVTLGWLPSPTYPQSYCQTRDSRRELLRQGCPEDLKNKKPKSGPLDHRQSHPWAAVPLLTVASASNKRILAESPKVCLHGWAALYSRCA